MTFRQDRIICELEATMAVPWGRLGLNSESVKDFLCNDLPRGGREIDNRKRIVSRKRKGKRKMDAIDLQSNEANRLISG